MKLTFYYFLFYVVYNVPKVIQFCGRIRLLQSKTKGGAFSFGPPCTS